MTQAAQIKANFGSNAEMAEAAATGRAVRIAEALLFAAREPLSAGEIAAQLPAGVSFDEVMAHLAWSYQTRGVVLAQVAGGYQFRTAPDLAHLLVREVNEPRKLSRAAVETLAIIAYHQPVTRAEIEEIRGVATARGTLDVLLETSWVRMRGRRKTPGRPITFGTTPTFLAHFGLDHVGDLPGLDELKGAGLFDGRLPKGVHIPMPSDAPELTDSEEPLEPELALTLVPEPEPEFNEDREADDTPEPANGDEPLDPLADEHGRR
jgi:segregation and condensation protein B